MNDKEIGSIFFGTVEGKPFDYKCKANGCGEIVKKSGSSWCNVAGHFRRKHPDELAAREAVKLRGQKQLDFDMFEKRTVDIYRWVEFIVHENHPFTVVESEWLRRQTSLTKVSRHTIADVIEMVGSCAFNKMAERLPQKFGLLFDGWSENGVHYCATFAVYSTGSGQDLKRIEKMLHFGTFRYEDSFKAEDYIAHFNDILENIGRTFEENVLFVVSDNCKVNRAVARLVAKPFVGCAAHRLNLAVEDIYEVPEYKTLIDKVHALMKVLKTLKGAGKLRAAGAPAGALHRTNDTRWGIVYLMLKRYVHIHPYISYHEEFWQDVLLSPQEHNRIKNDLLPILEKFEHANKALQFNSTDVDLYFVRVLFDSLIEHVPSCAKYLAPNAEIVHSQDFENAVVKQLRGDERLLLTMEKNMLAGFKTPVIEDVDEEVADEQEETNFVKAAFETSKRRRIVTSTSAYIDLRFIPPTSVTAERFFSRASLVTGLLRQGLSEEKFRAILFLHYNRDCWDIADVAVAMASVSEANAIETNARNQVAAAHL